MKKLIAASLLFLSAGVNASEGITTLECMHQSKEVTIHYNDDFMIVDGDQFVRNSESVATIIGKNNNGVKKVEFIDETDGVKFARVNDSSIVYACFPLESKDQ